MSADHGTIVPEGFTLRPRAALSQQTLAARAITNWRRDLERLLAAGADERWITPKEARMGTAAGVVGALNDRGAILIAERGATKRYRLTAYGVAIAQGGRR